LYTAFDHGSLNVVLVYSFRSWIIECCTCIQLKIMDHWMLYLYTAFDHGSLNVVLVYSFWSWIIECCTCIQTLIIMTRNSEKLRCLFWCLKIYLAHLSRFFELYDIATGALNNFKKTLYMY